MLSDFGFIVLVVAIAWERIGRWLLDPCCGMLVFSYSLALDYTLGDDGSLTLRRSMFMHNILDWAHPLGWAFEVRYSVRQRGVGCCS